MPARDEQPQGGALGRHRDRRKKRRDQYDVAVSFATAITDITGTRSLRREEELLVDLQVTRDEQP
jgi:hypothetical protein